MISVTRLSLSEIDALCRKAARGAGYSWGMAEEAGRSARWLAAFDLQGPEALATWLDARSIDGVQHQPGLLEGVWRAPKGICPLTAGTVISDRESQLLKGGRFEFATVVQPVLMLSMVARIVEHLESSIIFSLGDCDITCTAQGIFCPEGVDWQKEESDVICCLGQSERKTTGDIIKPSAQGRMLTEHASEELHRLAHQTYVPATEASRLSGAGSGLSDND